MEKERKYALIELLVGWKMIDLGASIKHLAETLKRTEDSIKFMFFQDPEHLLIQYVNNMPVPVYQATKEERARQRFTKA